MPKADFSAWSRATLERFARDVADQNLQLRADVRTALDAYRALLRAQLVDEQRDQTTGGTPS